MAEPSSLKCSVIICAYNGAAVLPACLSSLLKSESDRFEIIVVDNGSADGSATLVSRDFPGVRLIRTGRNLGFAGGNNVGIRASRGRVVVLLNQDTEVPPDWLTALLAAFERESRIGAVGCKLYYPDGVTIQHAGGVVYPNGNTVHHGCGQRDEGQWDAAGPMDYVTGAALGLRREALAEVGLLDPGFYPAYYEELDLERRLLTAGWTVWYEPSASLIHHESQVHGIGSPATLALYVRNRIRYLALHGFPCGRRAALAEEWRWLGDIRRRGRLLAVLRGYAAGLIRWPLWRLDRRRRKSLPRWSGAMAPASPSDEATTAPDA